MGARKKSGRRGQGLTEYVILVGLVGILLVGATKTFSRAVGRAYGASTSAVERIATSIETRGADGGWSAPGGGGGGGRGPRDGEKVEPCKHGPGLVDPETGVCANCGEVVD